MKYVDEFRDPVLARRLIQDIKELATRPWVLMEVCGGQTHGLLRSGIVQELDGVIELIHGPGCPVCVTPAEAIDFAQEISLRPGTILTSFGDMLRVPGSRESLVATRARGGDVRAVYSPIDAVELARREPSHHVVFFAVGFETTAPATALAIQQARKLQLTNFSLLVAHVRVQPAMEALLQATDCRVQGFLAAGHVCSISGFQSYADLAGKYHVPIVVTGFEPVDLLLGIKQCIEQLERGQAEVCNQYTRNVSAVGNVDAQRIVDEVYEVADCPWRGLGTVKNGGFRLRTAWQEYDARQRFYGLNLVQMSDSVECISADVLSGRIKPTACPSFGNRCTPESPLGAPMVSSEGACAAYYRYRRSVLPMHSVADLASAGDT